MSELRELVVAWQRQLDQCDQAYKVACVAIGRELSAVGGYATTSPGEDGCVTTFSWKKDVAGWTVGVAKVGDTRCGVLAPHHPEVGDRCHEMEQVWRKEAMAFGEAQRAVRLCVRRLAGAEMDPETIALALMKSEKGEREAAAQFVRSFVEAATVNGGQLLVNRIADAIERGEHLR